MIRQSLCQSIAKHSDNNAFCINGIFYTYAKLQERIRGIRALIRECIGGAENVVGLVVHDDLDTYASIFALWFEGKAYVPLNPYAPKARNRNIVTQSGLSLLLNSKGATYDGIVVLDTSKAKSEEGICEAIAAVDVAYVLFTSGSTGVPKGVPISFDNLDAFVDGFYDLGYEIGPTDKCLQMFDLTFDLSVMSYLIPLLNGACVYTIPATAIKYQYVAELLEDRQLTVALMVPSILHYLRPYFDEMRYDSMRYSLFCGEALPTDLAEEWSKCVPFARIDNVYGPTEDTIFCTSYQYGRNGKNKELNGILSIGRAMKGTMTLIVDEKNDPVPKGKVGELCLAGRQLTSGYWNNEQKNRENFFYHGGIRFYKTGDLCSEFEGDLMYHGRLDFQVKIQGFRVELGEVEFAVKKVLERRNNVAAVAFENGIGNTEIGVFIESETGDKQEIMEGLKRSLPSYMLPGQIHFVEKFPLNANGKTDRKKLLSWITR